ncbi:hypothetical protein SAMN05444144_101109 [Flavobacterium akiainvivens]|nr:hypothetical protein SAMN05444144_101109 [Flavobacterium akiainvivens]
MRIIKIVLGIVLVIATALPFFFSRGEAGLEYYIAPLVLFILGVLLLYEGIRQERL